MSSALRGIHDVGQPTNTSNSWLACACGEASSSRKLQLPSASRSAQLLLTTQQGRSNQAHQWAWFLRGVLGVALLSRLMFQEGLLPSPPLSLSIACRRSFRLNSMPDGHSRLSPREPILEARWGAAIVRSIIASNAPRLNVSFLHSFKTIRSFLRPSCQPRFPSYLGRPHPTGTTYHSSHPLWGTARQPHLGFPQEGRSGSRRPRTDHWGRSSSCTHAHPPTPPKRTPRLTPENRRRSNQGYRQGCRPSLMHPDTRLNFQTICTAH